MAQFNRLARLTVGQPSGDGVVIEGLKITFDIDKDLTQHTNKSNVKVYNLASATRAKMERPDSICILEVGYSEDVGLRRIFCGAIIQSWTSNDGPDAVTELTLSDGQVAIRDSVLSVGYSVGVNGSKIANDIAGQMGLVTRIGSDVSFSDYPNGFSFAGYARTALGKICDAAGATWSIQNNELQIIMGGGTTGIRALVFSAESGLVGSPERIVKGVKRADSSTASAKKKKRKKSKKETKEKKAGWKIKTLLAPTVNPGDAVRVESTTVTGWFRVESLKHNGDTHGKDWYTEHELIEVILD